MAETTHNTMPPQQDYEEDYTGPPQISDITFSTKGFPKISTTCTDSNSTVQPVQNIPQPAAQKMALAKIVTTSLARFFKKAACEGENAVECLARQTINLIKHKANPASPTPPPATTVQPELVKSPCKMDPSKPGCYAWADLTNKIIAPVLNRLEKFEPGYLDQYPSDKSMSKFVFTVYFPTTSKSRTFSPGNGQHDPQTVCLNSSRS